MSEDFKEYKKVAVNNRIATFLKRCDDEGNNLLHYVVKSDNVQFAEQLIKAGCDVNKENNREETPLELAICENQLEMVKLLVNAGADIKNCQTWMTPLHLAANYGCPNIVKFLLDKGAKVNAHSDSTGTALHCACFGEANYNEADYCQVIQILIDAGAEINAVDNDHHTPLFKAFNYDYRTRFELLLSMGANVRFEDSEVEFEFLQIAIWRTDLTILNRLVKLGYDINMTNNNGNSLVHEAASCLRNDLLEFLFSNGAIININNHGCDPLYYTLEYRRNNYEIWRILNIQKWSNYSEICARLDKFLDILIKHGADVNYVTQEGMTPLYVALQSFTLESRAFVQVLLKHEAKVDFDHEIVRKVMNNTKGLKSLCLLLKHTAMCQAQNRSDGPKNFDLSKLNNESQKYYAQCRDELELMKATKIEDTNVSFFNILVNRDISPYTRNESIKNALGESDLFKRFPIYSDLLRKRFSKEVKFQKLVEKATNSLCYILKWDRNSTHLLLDNILLYMNEKDLASLALI